MNKIVFDKKSWHFRLATKYGPMYWHESVDICQYSRYVFGGFLACCLITGITVVALVFPMLTVVAIIARIPLWQTPIVIVIVEAVAILGGVAVYWLISWQQKRDPIEPGALKLMYRSWRDKYCVPVTFKQENK